MITRTARFLVRLLATAASLLFTLSAWAAPPHYTIQSLGAIVDQHLDRSTALGVNNSGTVVGYCQGSWPFTSTVAFRWTPSGGMKALPIAEGSAINSKGQITGTLHVSPVFGDIVGHAARVELDGSVTDLHKTANLGGSNIALGDIASGGTAINNSGQVVGDLDDFGAAAGFWETDTHFILPAINSVWASSVATGINDAGTLVGYCPENGAEHAKTIAFRYSTKTGFQSLQPQGDYRNSSAAGTNSAGDVIGYVSVPDGTGHYNATMTRWDSSNVPHFLGEGTGIAINDVDTAIGYRYDLQHPVLWTVQDGRVASDHPD